MATSLGDFSSSISFKQCCCPSKEQKDALCDCGRPLNWISREEISSWTAGKIAWHWVRCSLELHDKKSVTAFKILGRMIWRRLRFLGITWHCLFFIDSSLIDQRCFVETTFLINHLYCISIILILHFNYIDIAFLIRTINITTTLRLTQTQNN